MPTDEYQPRSPAPHTGLFEELDVFGGTTGVVAFVTQGEPLPAAPRSFVWRPLGVHSVEELRQRAAQYREMAATAKTEQAIQGLLKLAEKFDLLADQRAAGQA